MDGPWQLTENDESDGRVKLDLRLDCRVVRETAEDLLVVFRPGSKLDQAG